MTKCAEITGTALTIVACLAGFFCLFARWMRYSVGAPLESQAVVQGLSLAIPGLFFFTLNKVYLNVLNGLDHTRTFALTMRQSAAVPSGKNRSKSISPLLMRVCTVNNLVLEDRPWSTGS